MAKMVFEFEGNVSNSRFYDNSSSKRVTVELDDDNLNLSEVLNEFQNFLVAAGYHLDGRTVELVDGSEDDVYNRNWSDDWDNLPGSSEEDYVVSTTSGKYDFSDEEINAEIIRMRDSTPGLSEEAYEMAAWHNLVMKRDSGV